MPLRAAGKICWFLLTDCMNHGPRIVTPSFKPAFFNPMTASCTLFHLHVWMASMGNSLAYELNLFDPFCASQKVMKVWRNVFPVVHAISH